MKLSKRAYASLARSVPRWLLTCGSHLPADVGRQRGRKRRKPDLLVLEDRRLLSTFTVTSTADNGSSHTLRWAVAQANAATTASSIEVELGTSAATIKLTEGQLELSNTEGAITIYDGSGQGPVTVSGSGVSRVFQIDSQVTATITGLTIANGSTNANGGGIYNAGGATLELDDCTIESSSATGMGGGLDNDGMATLTECTISGNTSSGYGGAIENSRYYSKIAAMTLTDCMISGNYSPSGSAGLNNNGTVELTNCTLSGNTSGRSGGGMSTNDGWAELTGCTISNNTAAESGGGFSSWAGTAPSKLTDCTISGNTTLGPGGAVDDMGETVYLTNCTLADNTSQNHGGGVSIEGGATVDLTACTLSSNTTPGPGGGVYNGGMATLTDTIVAGNSGGTGGDIDGGTVTGSYNLLGSHSGGLVNGQHGNIVGVTDPLLAALGNYGKLTQTMPLLPGSAAIGAGTMVSGITTDQRGEPLDSPNPDIGAFQSQGFTLAPATGSTPQSTVGGTAFPNPLAVTVTANNAVEPVDGGIVTFTAPSSGASAALSSITAVIGAEGATSVNATANTIGGFYTVTATANSASATFSLHNLFPLSFSGLSSPSITYGTSSVTVSGTLADGSRVPQGETVAVTLDGVQHAATINSSGAFTTSFNPSSLTVSGSPYTISYAYTSDGTFGPASATSTLTVTKAAPTITWSDPADITYGTALSTTQLDATASVPGAFKYNPPAGTVLHAGTGQSLSVNFTPTDAADYTNASATVTINVEEATPTIAWSNPTDITYGTPLSATQLDATASVAGAFTYNPRAGAVLHVGTGQTLSVNFIPTDAADYTNASATVTINVEEATPTITWSNPTDITYGAPLSATQLDATSAVSGAFTYNPPAGTVLNTGTGQTLSVSFIPTDTNDYTPASATVMINVDKATPSIAWSQPANITYGSALSATQLDATASVPGTLTYNPPAGTVLNAGSGQTLSVSFTPTDTTDYMSASDTVKINVDQATPTITWANPAAITYGTALSGTQLDASANLPGAFAYTPPAGAFLGAGGGQTLSVTFTPQDSTDYGSVTATTTISVIKATPTLKLSDPGGRYDGSPFPASVTIAGSGNDNSPAASLGGVAPVLTYYDGLDTSGASLGSTPPTAAGTYTVVAGFAGNADYLAVQSAPVTFTIGVGTATIALTSSTGSTVYGQAITFVAKVAAGVSPGGTVTFLDAGTALATVALDSSGAATLITSALALGSHSITATYGGDAGLSGAKSGPASESVGQARTSVVLVPHPVLKKKKVKSEVLTAEIEPTLPGGGIPTGRVTFELLTKKRKKIKTKVLGTAAVSGGDATFAFKPGRVLRKVITIVYSGDTDFRASTLTAPKLSKKGLL